MLVLNAILAVSKKLTGCSLENTPLSANNSVGGVNTGGYGYIPTVGGAGDTPRSGQLVGRFTF